MEEEQTGTHTLAEWKAWYAEHRPGVLELKSGMDPVPEDETILERLWLPADGKLPRGTRLYSGMVWKSRKLRTPVEGIAFLFAKGHSPLLLIEPEAELPAPPPRRKKKQTSKKPKQETLSPPFEWRCRGCDREMISDVTPVHCGLSMRQLAPVSKSGSERFSEFLAENEWTFLDPEESTLFTLKGVKQENEALSLAREAGESLEKVLREVAKEVPQKFELYNERTDHVRVSDLKTDDKFISVFDNIGQWREDESVPATLLPSGNEEIGHVFDEFLTYSLANTTDDEWGPGERVEFCAEDLGITIGGTPDLMFRGIPVEMKTISFMPHEGKKELRRSFGIKWHGNYLPQIAMYLEGTDLEWMLLMLVSRRSGLFTMLPITGVKMKTLRKSWCKLLEDDELAEQVANYREAIDSEE